MGAGDGSRHGGILKLVLSVSIIPSGRARQSPRLLSACAQQDPEPGIPDIIAPKGIPTFSRVLNIPIESRLLCLGSCRIA